MEKAAKIGSNFMITALRVKIIGLIFSIFRKSFFIEHGLVRFNINDSPINFFLSNLGISA